MIRLTKIASMVTIHCIIWSLVVLPVSGYSREESQAATGISPSGEMAEDTAAAPIVKPGEKKARKKFPWLLAGLGAAAVVVAVVLLTGKKDSSSINWGDVEYGTVTDIDGNVYRTVRIGNQEWMAENLKTTKYRNGDPIANVTNTWFNLTYGVYGNYDNDPSNVATYGRLYNWYSVNDSRGLAPAGWHVATDADWAELIAGLGGESVAGGKLKEAGTAHWSSPNEGATNESGFTALPGGYRNPDGPYFHFGNVGLWWTATLDNSSKAWRLSLRYSDSMTERASYYLMGGLSVRCVKD